MLEPCQPFVNIPVVQLSAFFSELEHVSKVFENSVDVPPKIEEELNIGEHFKAYSAIMNNA